MDAPIQLFISVVSGMVIGAFTAFVTAQQAFRRFHSERWWERKAAAYTDALEALYAMYDYAGTVEELLIMGRREDARDESIDTQVEAYKRAVEALNKTILVGALVLSDGAVDLLREFRQERSKAILREDVAAFTAEATAARRAIEMLRIEAIQDLKINEGWVQRPQRY